MKTSIAIVAFLLISFGLQAIPGGDDISYVKTDNKVYFGQDVKMGMFNTKVIASDGAVTKVRNKDVTAYMHDAKLYESLPLVCDSKDKACFALMEYVTTRGGLNLYRYCCYRDSSPKYQYYVYKGGEYHLRIDQKNAKTVLPFFGIKVV